MIIEIQNLLFVECFSWLNKSFYVFQVEVLHGQLENVQRDLSIKEVELKHLTLQLELLTKQNAAHVNELQEKIAALKVSAASFSLKITYLI